MHFFQKFEMNFYFCHLYSQNSWNRINTIIHFQLQKNNCLKQKSLNEVMSKKPYIDKDSFTGFQNGLVVKMYEVWHLFLLLWGRENKLEWSWLSPSATTTSIKWYWFKQNIISNRLLLNLESYK